MASEKKERGKFLTTMIVIMGILISLNIVGTFSSEDYLGAGAPDWVYVVHAVLTFVEAAVLIGVFLWKRLAVWGHAAIMVATLGLNIVYSSEPKLDQFGIYPWILMFLGTFVLGATVLYFWSIKRKWKYFE